jgi:DNA mismatch endonuclease (patch repair protein)
MSYFVTYPSADVLSPEKRSQLMARVRHKDTNIEKKVRSYLHKRGFRFRKHVAILPGSPDIVLPKYRVTIFIHGCFWHGHYGCRKSRLPKARHSFWEEKRRANLERDARKISELINFGWRVAVVWQCALEKPTTLSHTMEMLEDWIKSDRTKCEIPNNSDTPQV